MPVCSDKRGITGAETTKEMLKFFFFLFYKYICLFFFMNLFFLFIYVFTSLSGDNMTFVCFVASEEKPALLSSFVFYEIKKKTDGRTRDIVLSIARRFVSDRKSQANWETEALH